MTFEQNQPANSISDGQIVAAQTGAVAPINAEIQPAPGEFVEAYVAHIVPQATSITASDESTAGVDRDAIFLPPNPSSHFAIGGAVGGAALGFWTIVTGFLTPFAILNALPGVLFSLWGLSSPRKNTARIALVLNLLGVIIAVGNSIGWGQHFGTNRNIPTLNDPDQLFDHSTE